MRVAWDRILPCGFRPPMLASCYVITFYCPYVGSNPSLLKIGPEMKNAPPTGGHVFQQTETIFKLIQDFIGTHVLTQFQEDWAHNVASKVLTRKTATSTFSHVFQQTGTIFELIQSIIGTHVQTKFHEDWTINVASIEHDKQKAITKAHPNLPPPGSHVFQTPGTISELVQSIIETHVLTKFHED
ncbi:hypothetical protein DPMN_041516 [Dreissena polymorpha]|uniref:Uncharacterized protein n=1 Tax=Dreissena polymorpha TaxID=45954 RepID=A0A9D4HTZ6_DREPO|nr:hypothetical protein DPMN_041516 [Dreissena polymorpha]